MDDGLFAKNPWGSPGLGWLLLGRPVGLCVGRERGANGLSAQRESEREGSLFSFSLFLNSIFKLFCILKYV
jgi:hypothetical protein